MRASRPRLIAPPQQSTPADLRRTGHRDRPLPDDLLREASHRLGVMSLLAAAMWILATVLYHIVDRVLGFGDQAWWSFRPSDTITVASVVVSLGMFVYSRTSQRSPRFLLDLGLVYMVVMSLGVGLIWHWDLPSKHAPIAPAITWIGAIILMFAATVPSPPGRTLIAGLIAASMNPIGMLVAKARGIWDFGPDYGVLLMHYPDYLLVAVSVVISHVVTRLGQQVAKARELGSYQLGELLGRGGMGEVYKATHRMLARPAAIKLIRPEVIGAHKGEGAAMAVTRFRREAETAASLRSPHTVALYDFGVTDDGTLYFAMELLEGMDLETLVRRHGPLPPSRVVHILRQACESLEEAHARGLVHRDIKPANLHIGQLGLRHDVVKVLDFGLVRSISRADDSESLATAAGVIPGTPAYMAPEMALGEAVDGRADLYALASVAYFLLSGSLVFEANGGMQMIVKRLHEDPTPIAERAEQPIPPELNRIIMSGLARDPRGRPETAAAMTRALEQIPLAQWTEDQARQWWLTHGTVGIDNTVGGDAPTMFDSQEATRTRRVAVSREPGSSDSAAE
jgi:tRNA A-37 threonylcarbamoyl transferase component Bud32